MTAWLAPAIGLVALLYSSVGHAGATGYVAVMALAGLAPEVIRPTALVLNVCVAAIATVQFTRAGHLRRDLVEPLVAGSVPAAFIGGAIGLPPAVFEALLGAVLAASALRLAGRAVVPATGAATAPAPPRPEVLATVGGAIGLVSGLTGVGGGVFLTPALLALKAAAVREVAATSAAFILVNSLAGLAGRAVAGGTFPPVSLPVIAAAAVGGTVGSGLGAFRLPIRALESVMATVLAIAAAKLIGPLLLRGAA